MTNNLTLASHFKLYTPLDRACYLASLALVAEIDEDLKTGRRYYRTKAGTLLTALDEVVRAILADDLTIGEASRVGVMTVKDYQRIMRPIYRQQQQRLRLKRKLQLAT